MKLFAFTLATALLAIPRALSQSEETVSVSFDRTYDNPAGDTNTVACSNGINGLARSFPNFTSLPNFPHIGGAPAIAGFDSPNCGTCWELTFRNKTIHIFAIDVASKGFNIALSAMNDLTGGIAEELGRVNATARQVVLDGNCEQGMVDGKKRPGL